MATFTDQEIAEMAAILTPFLTGAPTADSMTAAAETARDSFHRFTEAAIVDTNTRGALVEYLAGEMYDSLP